MQKTTKNNSIYLSGGGDENQSSSLDEYFFNKLPKAGHFLYMPTALRGNDLYTTASSWIAKVLDLHGRTDLTFETADDLTVYNDENIKVFDAIYIGGGNTWNLMSELRSSVFINKLTSFIENGGVVYGGSAGAIILGNRINTQDDDNKINFDNVLGLNCLRGYSIACHYKDDQADRFKSWANQNRLPVICLPEETGLIIEDNSILCAGTKPCFIYTADGKTKEVQPLELFL